jgi:aminoglycoside phosphotransferase (APT) family kinase protein
MSLAPVIGSADLDVLCAAVAAEDRGADLSAAVLRSGWENVVVETAEWIYRFPRESNHAFDRELAILERVRGRLPAPTPRVEWVGQRTRFAAYRKLAGTAFDSDAYGRAASAQRDVVARSLAEFLAAMHDCLSPAEIAALGVPVINDGSNQQAARPRLDLVPSAVRATVDAVLEAADRRWSAGAVPGPPVLLHNDFHAGNLVLDGPVGEVVGVWDFSCVGLGSPSFELRYFEAESLDLLARLAVQYERATGRVIDVDAAVLANRVECICDALDTDDAGSLEAAVARWQRFDVGRS